LETIKIYARACAPDDPGQCSEASNQVEVLESQFNWCPQRSYWEGTIKDGALKGEEMTFRFRDSDGHFSTFSWQMPGVYGFWDTDLHLYSCCAEQTQAMTVTADGTVYTPTSHEGTWYHFDITGGAHDVTIQSQCGDEKSESSGEILIDPDGYVFNVDEGGRYDPTMGGSFNPVEPISGVTVTCMMSAPQWGGWVPWPAHLYEDQVNPQVTDDVYPDGITITGYYAFFTPPGHYYLQVEGIPGYQAWRSPVVEVITQIVHVNVPYTPWVSDTEVYSVSVMPAPVEVGDGTLWAGVLLDPAVITVPVGSVVEWTSTLSETNTVDDLIRWSENPIFQVLSERDPLQDTRGFDSGYLEPGRVYRRAFAYPGVYTYTVHGRSGRVIVTDERSKIYLPVVLRD
jgi:plastocyanin